MPVTFDETNPRCVILRVSGPVTDDEMRSIFALVERGLARAKPFGLLVDTRGGVPLSAAQGAMIIDHMKGTAAAAERLLVQAMVIESALVRAFYYAVSWAYPMSFPSRVFAELEPARQWLELQLRNKDRERRASPAA